MKTGLALLAFVAILLVIVALFALAFPHQLPRGHHELAYLLIGAIVVIVAVGILDRFFPREGRRSQ